MLLLGICNIYRDVLIKEYKKPETKLTSNGIIMIVLGLVILYHHNNADSVIGSIRGLIGLAKGSEELNLAIYYMANKKAFLKELIQAILELLLSLLLLVDPMSAMKHHLFILGFELIILGLHIISETKAEINTV